MQYLLVYPGQLKVFLDQLNSNGPKCTTFAVEI